MAGSTTATIHVKPTSSAILTVNGSTGASAYLPIRALNGLYNGVGITASRNTRNLKTALPSANVPIGYVEVDGKRLPVQIDDVSWYSFLRYQTEVVLGGFQASTLADIANSVTTDQALAIATQALAAASSQQVIANAQSLAAVREVAVSAALPGAAQIPAVQLVPFDLSGGSGE